MEHNFEWLDTVFVLAGWLLARLKDYLKTKIR